MRSVVVVLPASIWAMMPMLRNLLSGACLAINQSVSPCGSSEKLAPGPLTNLRPNRLYLPSVMREGFVRISHAMHIFTLLDRIALARGGIENFTCQLVCHRFLAATARNAHEPAHGQC